MPVGRPEISIDWKDVGNCIEMGMPATEISKYLGIHSDTLYERCFKDNGIYYTEFSDIFKAKGDKEIYYAQYDEAVNKRDKTLLIWLGKCRLKQTETVKQEINVVNEFRQAITDAENGSSPLKDNGPSLENGASVLDKGCEGQENSMHSQLGTEGAIPQHPSELLNTES